MIRWILMIGRHFPLTSKKQSCLVVPHSRTQHLVSGRARCYRGVLGLRGGLRSVPSKYCTLTMSSSGDDSDAGSVGASSDSDVDMTAADASGDHVVAENGGDGNSSAGSSGSDSDSGSDDESDSGSGSDSESSSSGTESDDETPISVADFVAALNSDSMYQLSKGACHHALRAYQETHSCTHALLWSVALPQAWTVQGVVP